MITLDECFKKALHPDNVVINAFEKRQLVVFLGAGVSRLMGLPGWDELSDKLIKGAYNTHIEQQSILREIKNSKEKITIAYRKYVEDNREKEFFAELGKAFVPKKKGCDIYKILAQFNATFLTTNADGLFEKELGEQLCHSDLDENIIYANNFHETNHLFYLHGKYLENNIKNNRELVFTASAYVKKYTDSKTVKFLLNLFKQENVIVFIGYGLNEFELIDYIMTKTGVTQSNKGLKSDKGEEKAKNVYMLEGFCSNQAELFFARKNYFDDLGIELLPYDLDDKGYDALCDVLKSWLSDFNTKTNLPAVIGTDIEHYIRAYSENNAAQIHNILNTKRNSVAIDEKIVQEVLASKDREKWIERFIAEGLFSCEKLEQAIEYGKNEMPYWHLLINALSVYNNNAQDVATNLINDIIKAKIKFNQENAYIVSLLVQLILRLDNKHIRMKHLNLIRKLVKQYGYRVFGFDRNILLPRLNDWSKGIVKAFINILSVNLEAFDNYNDLNYHYFEKIFNELNSRMRMDCAPLVVDWLVNTFEATLKVKAYCLLSRIMNIDNVQKNHSRYWILLIKEYQFVLDMLSIEEKKSIIQRLFDSTNIVLNKLALYTCRICKWNPNDVVFGILQTISDYKCECELYIYLKEQAKDLTEANAEEILHKIRAEKFGYENYDENDAVTQRHIDTHRLTLAMVLPNSRAYVKELEQKGVKADDPIAIADLCDYPHISQFKIDEQFNFDALLKNDFVAEFKNILTHADTIWHSNIVEKAVEILLSKDIKVFKNILEKIAYESKELINDFILNFNRIKDNLNAEQRAAIYDFCLDILAKYNGQMTVLAKHCFYYLSTIRIESLDIAERVRDCLKTWCNINSSPDYIQANDVWASFVNTADYSIFGLLIRYLIYVREARREILGEAYMLDLQEYLSHNASARYCLSYNLPNLFYLFGKEAISLLPQLVFNNNNFDIHAMLFCTLNGNSVYKEVISFILEHKIVKSYLTEICNYVDRNMRERFYNYLMVGYFDNIIDKDAFMLLAKSNNFIDYYLHNIGLYHKDDMFNFDKHICEFYEDVKTGLSKDVLSEICDAMLHELRYMKNPTNYSLDVYISVVDEMGDNQYEIIDTEKLLMFLDLNFDKAYHLVQRLIGKVQYFSDSDMEKIVIRMKELGKQREGCELLNSYYDRFSKSIDGYKRLNELLNK